MGASPLCGQAPRTDASGLGGYELGVFFLDVNFICRNSSANLDEAQIEWPPYFNTLWFHLSIILYFKVIPFYTDSPSDRISLTRTRIKLIINVGRAAARCRNSGFIEQGDPPLLISWF